MLLRRRIYRDSDRSGNGPEEFTEETISTITDNTEDGNVGEVNGGEWAQTQDNPLFASENFGDDDDDAFNDAFEETGFFTS